MYTDMIKYKVFTVNNNNAYSSCSGGCHIDLWDKICKIVNRTTVSQTIKDGLNAR